MFCFESCIAFSCSDMNTNNQDRSDEAEERRDPWNRDSMTLFLPTKSACQFPCPSPCRPKFSCIALQNLSKVPGPPPPNFSQMVRESWAIFIRKSGNWIGLIIVSNGQFSFYNARKVISPWNMDINSRLLCLRRNFSDKSSRVISVCVDRAKLFRPPNFFSPVRPYICTESFFIGVAAKKRNLFSYWFNPEYLFFILTVTKLNIRKLSYVPISIDLAQDARMRVAPNTKNKRRFMVPISKKVTADKFSRIRFFYWPYKLIIPCNSPSVNCKV